MIWPLKDGCVKLENGHLHGPGSNAWKLKMSAYLEKGCLQM